MATLEIKDLHVEVEDKDKKTRKKILKGVNLTSFYLYFHR